MDDNYYVQIVEYDNDDVIREMGPFRSHMADSIDDGLNINLNHDKYYTLIERKG